MDTFLKDLRYALRALGRNPGFTAVATLTLVLGIGANSAVFSVVDAVLLRPLPFPEPDRIVRLWSLYAEREGPPLEASEEEFLDYQAQNQTLSELGAFISLKASLSGEEQPERVQATFATSGLFSTLGVGPALGRVYGPEEDKPGAPPVAVISYGLWQRQFGSDPGLLGQSVLLNGRPVTIIGVMPLEFRFPRETDVWSPLGIDPANPTPRTEHYLTVIGRLKDGVPLERATDDLNAIARRFGERFPTQYPADSGWGVSLTSLLEDLVGDTRPQLLILLAAVVLVLLIACVNVANLLLARAQTRDKEVSIRVALGATRGRVIRQSITESVLIALAGGLLGFLVARWGIAAFLAINPDPLPRAGEIAVDARVFGFTLLLGLLTGVILGLVPALRAFRPDLQAALKEAAGKTTGSVGQHRFRRFLVGLEVALALILLIGSGLMVKSFARLKQVNPGFRADNLLTLELALPRSGYPDDAQVSRFYDELVGRLEALPGVEGASVISYLPFSNGINRSATVGPEGMSFSPGDALPEPEVRSVDYRYFRSMGIPLAEGRELTAADDMRAYPMALIDEVLARQLWLGQPVTGKRLKMGPPTEENPNPWVTIVGVVREAKQSSLAGEARGVVYFPQLRRAERGQFVVLRTAGGDPLRLAGAVQEQVRAMDRGLPVSDIKTMEQRLNASLAKPRFTMWLMAVFAILAAVLAAVGIYGVVAYTVNQRTHEIGIRMALGARRNDIVAMVIRQGMGVVLVGVACGLIASFLLTRGLAGLLYDVEVNDLATFSGTPVLLAVVALVANLLPARRATRVEPIIALRRE